MLIIFIYVFWHNARDRSKVKLHQTSLGSNILRLMKILIFLLVIVITLFGCRAEEETSTNQEIAIGQRFRNTYTLVNNTSYDLQVDTKLYFRDNFNPVFSGEIVSEDEKKLYTLYSMGGQPVPPSEVFSEFSLSTDLESETKVVYSTAVDTDWDVQVYMGSFFANYTLYLDDDLLSL